MCRRGMENIFINPFTAEDELDKNQNTSKYWSIWRNLNGLTTQMKPSYCGAENAGGIEERLMAIFELLYL